jgi:hypothetical protein
VENRRRRISDTKRGRDLIGSAGDREGYKRKEEENGWTV